MLLLIGLLWTPDGSVGGPGAVEAIGAAVWGGLDAAVEGEGGQAGARRGVLLQQNIC